MTITEGKRGAGSVTANPTRGVRIERVPEKSLRHTEAGRIGLPLRVVDNGVAVADGELVLTHDEAAGMRLELDRLLVTAEGGAA
ncbi:MULTISPECIES: hypothetical protein [Streptomyces]|uniref:hypothetical protein n=1 Tax=Streptomyces TaxID=1883 RepID=UPI00163CC8BD|nr:MULTISPECIES: hypothetical protein [Streptomyces]MBC2878874.1 hypothetical protein [Streptomyces sp. TYQ1024]UBI38939.1 hypothetical protein K7I03_22440 [Streptomyces mobaraensis]UKW31518.1 hypothetical protein MCU78_22385 [Streptomyces sp. TYQ1024]